MVKFSQAELHALLKSSYLAGFRAGAAEQETLKPPPPLFPKLAFNDVPWRLIWPGISLFVGIEILLYEACRWLLG
jgi:hypothetical protein